MVAILSYSFIGLFYMELLGSLKEIEIIYFKVDLRKIQFSKAWGRRLYVPYNKYNHEKMMLSIEDYLTPRFFKKMLLHIRLLKTCVGLCLVMLGFCEWSLVVLLRR